MLLHKINASHKPCLVNQPGDTTLNGFWMMLMVLIHWGKNISTVKEYKETLLVIRKEIGLEVNKD
jgi:hypothetical protein